MNYRFIVGAAIVLQVFGVMHNIYAIEGESGGRDLYMQYCSSCHGVRLQGGNAQSLVDGVWQYGDRRGYIQRSSVSPISGCRPMRKC